MVIFSKHDFEAMTVVNVPDTIIREQTQYSGRQPFPLRLLPRLKPMPLTIPMPEECFVQLKVIDIWVEPLCRRKTGHFRSFEECLARWGNEGKREYDNQFMWTWVGYADDNGLDLQSVFLPGQEFDVQAREAKAEDVGFGKGVGFGYHLGRGGL